MERLIMKRLTACILLLIMAIYASGQTLAGKVTDEQDRPLSYANVVFLSLPDSAFVAGAVSGENGGFRLSVDERKGVLKVSCIGYTTLYKECQAGETLSLQLQADAQLLDEVVVKGDLPKTRLKNGASITTVAGSVLEKAGTAENLL
ncbi:carboxypeptidase-like regulatory domain-containing protein, partial [uncultured Bacteroides sp.]|uniref:carboxypeptidase-like regulatory domain-containing protein n=1 Tax=uncultured Bacteroides sp. TaxID=162156 RepID=UPI0026367B9F